MLTRYALVIEKHPLAVVGLVSTIFFVIFVCLVCDVNAVLFMLVSGIISYVLAFLLSVFIKLLTKVSRVDTIKSVHDYRFPSTHVSIATALSLTYYIVFSFYVGSFARLVVLFTMIIIIVATSAGRYIIGAHVMREIVAGVILGIFVSIISVSFVGWLI